MSVLRNAALAALLACAALGFSAAPGLAGERGDLEQVVTRSNHFLIRPSHVNLLYYQIVRSDSRILAGSIFDPARMRPDLAARAERAGVGKLAARNAPRCRRRCAQRERVCHTERRCSYATNRCRDVQVCRTRCSYWETYPSNCTP